MSAAFGVGEVALFGQWITSPAPSDGTVTDRPKRARFQGAPVLVTTSGTPSARGRDRTSANILAARLTTVAHPLHATALTIHAVTGADISRLALIRGIDIDETATTVKVHDSTAHRRCRLYPLPSWARRLIHAANIHGQLEDRAPDSPLFPLITVQDGEQLRLTATGIHYAFGPIRQEDAVPRYVSAVLQEGRWPPVPA
ncbi:hypothetical protein [Streptomyces sp. NPDC058335]|uniref:hypothetical protein n=1 Tax=Streptomyces sp. NPDC058335 TaxID=3346451 RepID=UPI0036589511